MHKYVALVMGLIMMFTVGCSRSMNIRETLEQNNRQYTEIHKITKDISIYYSDIQQIFIKVGNTERYISEQLASAPIISPDNKKIAYISPYEFESIGELYIYNIPKKKKTTAIKVRDLETQNTVKSVAWLDDRYLFIIIGYAYGTVTVGGSLYLYDSVDNRLNLILSPEEEGTEIKDFTIKSSEIIIDIAKHNEERTEHTVEQQTFKIHEILHSIELNQ